MEETIGYAGFFAPIEWEAILTDDWSILDDEEGDSSPPSSSKPDPIDLRLDLEAEDDSL